MSVEVNTLIIGCGNLLRGDDAAGPLLIRRLWELGLPPGVRCADGGTGGMDVAFQMRGIPNVILVDAAHTGAEPGTIFKVPGFELEQLPPLAGLNPHSFRWDQALAFGRWLLKEDYPKNITVYLIEAENFAFGADLSAPVKEAIERLAAQLFEASRASGQAIGASTTIERQNGRWVVYLEVGFWNKAEGMPLKVTRRRINDYPTRRDAEVAASWMRRAADRNIRRPVGGKLV